MTMTKRRYYTKLAVLTLCLGAQPALACRHEAPRRIEVPLEGIAVIEVAATSGDLHIHGEPDLSAAVAQGIACANSSSGLPEIQITTARIEERLRIVAAVPFDSSNEWRIGSLHLDLSLPVNIPLEVSDSSGNIKISDVAALTLTDSSGDIDMRNIPGEVLILRDSTGDIAMRNVGPVIIQIDSSGDIRIAHADSVVIELDTSGDIEISDVVGSVSVGSDTSGSIEVERIGGNFTVADDSGGGIRHRTVAGKVLVPRH